MAEPLVELEGVSKRFKGARQAALDGITAAAQGGQVTGLVGPDAAGKTTLLRLIAGLLAPSGGTVRVAGGADRSEPGTLGYMPQAFGLYEDLTVAENLSLYADLQGLPQAERAGRLKDLYGFTGLGPFTGRLAGKLSGGMKQKLGLACVLVRPPRVLLLDEPSVGVDPVSRRELWQMVRDLAGEGMAVLWSTAYLDEAGRCDAVWMLNEGQLIASGSPDDFLAEVRGRCYRLALPEDGRRSVQTKALETEGVLDAQVQGRSLRLLLAEGAAPPDGETLGADSAPEEVTPRFEDAYVARLRSGGLKTLPEAPGAQAPQHAGDGQSAAIEAEALSKRFGSFTAVDRVSFQVAPGEIFGLLGPNGAGKSTTFRMLCGLLEASAGRARVAGLDLAHARAEARGRIGYMSQSFSLYGDLSVRQNLKFFAGVYGLSGRRARSAMEQAVEAFALQPYARSNAGDLPLGFKQRLALACAVLHRPAILFLDEPTSGVDPLTRREFWSRINAMAEQGVTVLVTSHFLDEAEYCDRLAIMYKSRVVALGTPDDLKAEHAGAADASLEDAFIELIRAEDAEAEAA